MKMKYSVLVVSVGLMMSAFGLGGCVAQTAETDDVSESLSGDLRSGSDLGGTGDVSTVGNDKNLRSAPVPVQVNQKSDPGFDPKVHVFGNPEPQPWTEPKRGPVSEGH